MADERYVFPTLVEGLRRTLGDALTPTVKAQLRALELDLDKPMPPAWPGALSPRWTELCAATLFPAETRDEALRLFGRRFISSWQETLLGSAASLMMRTVGPKRALSRVERAFRTGDNFTRVTSEFVSDGDALVRFSDVQGMPTYFQGVLEQGTVMVGAVNARVSIEASEPPGATYRVRFD